MRTKPKSSSWARPGRDVGSARRLGLHAVLAAKQQVRDPAERRRKALPPQIPSAARVAGPTMPSWLRPC